MSAQRGVVGVVLVLSLLALGRPAGSVGPPPAGPVRLTEEQDERLARWGRGLDQALFSGEMGRGLRLAQEVESLRRRWQGPQHWQTVDARYAVEDWSRLARLGEAEQKEAGRAARQNAVAGALHARGQYAAAEKACREALAIRRKALGE